MVKQLAKLVKVRFVDDLTDRMRMGVISPADNQINVHAKRPFLHQQRHWPAGHAQSITLQHPYCM